jgi:hypothetical protein
MMVYNLLLEHEENREAAPVGERYYSPEEVAEKYNVSGVVVRKWLREGKLKPYFPFFIPGHLVSSLS